MAGVVLESETAEVVICGLFCLMAITISAYHVWAQLSAFSKPEHQTHVVRILIMVPIYAMGGWFALAFRKEEIYFDTIKVLRPRPFCDMDSENTLDHSI